MAVNEAKLVDLKKQKKKAFSILHSAWIQLRKILLIFFYRSME